MLLKLVSCTRLYRVMSCKMELVICDLVPFFCTRVVWPWCNFVQHNPPIRQKEKLDTIKAPIGVFHSSRDPHTLALSTLAEVVRAYQDADFEAALG